MLGLLHLKAFTIRYIFALNGAPVQDLFVEREIFFIGITFWRLICMNLMIAHLRASFSSPNRFRSFIAVLSASILMLAALFQHGGSVVKADTSIGTVAVGSVPVAVDINPATDKVYVANFNSASVTVIDGANNSTLTVAQNAGTARTGTITVANNVFTINQAEGIPAVLRAGLSVSGKS
jgi:hypothetical protein